MRSKRGDQNSYVVKATLAPFRWLFVFLTCHKCSTVASAEFGAVGYRMTDFFFLTNGDSYKEVGGNSAYVMLCFVLLTNVILAVEIS